MPDQRVDTDSRVRLAQLEARYLSLAHRLWLAIALLALFMVVTAVVIALQERARERNRIDVLTQLCHDDNRTHRGIQGFILEVAPDLVPLAQERFPTEPNCRKDAEEKVVSP